MLRRLREAWAQRRLDETLAWSYLATNLLVLPGLGSLMARRHVSGIGQAILALGGTGLALYWLISFARLWEAEGAFPLEGGPEFGYGLMGVGIFALGWLWSLVTSLTLIRQAQKESRDGGGPR